MEILVAASQSIKIMKKTETKKEDPIFKLNLDGAKIKKYLCRLHKKADELSEMIRYANNKHFMWIMITLVFFAISIFADLFEWSVWIDLGGTILGVIAFIFMLNWSSKLDKLKGARSGVMDAVQLLISVGMEDKFKALFHSLSSNIEKFVKESGFEDLEKEVGIKKEAKAEKPVKK